jgi:uncharacterized membrane protein YccC
MENKKKPSKVLKVIGYLFFVVGIFNVLGVLFNANGASLLNGLVGTVIGYVAVKPDIDSWLAKRKKDI